nr:MAG TPA: hypothetical protein [Caudoviricetes sp.]
MQGRSRTAAEREKTFWTYSEVQAPRLWLANS